MPRAASKKSNSSPIPKRPRSKASNSSSSEQPAAASEVTLESLKTDLDTAFAKIEAMTRDVREALLALRDFVKGLRAEQSVNMSSGQMSEVELRARLKLLEGKRTDLSNNFGDVAREFGAMKEGDGKSDDMAKMLGEL